MIFFRLFTILLLLDCLKTYYVESSLIFGCFKPKTSEETSSDQRRGDKLKKEFKEINAELVKRVSSDGKASDHMKVVELLLEKYEGGKKKKHIEAAKLILSLKALTDPKLCDRKGYDIVIENVLALDQEPALYRQQEVFRYYLKQQEKVCMRVFPDILKSKLSSMDSGKVFRLDYVVEQAMNRAQGKTEVEKLFTLIRKDNAGPEPAELERALSHLPLVSLSPEELEKKYSPEELVKVLQKKTIEHYLIEPCEYYIQELGPDMFYVASNWLYFHKPDIHQNQFYRSWVRVKFCENLFHMFKG